MIRSLMLLQLLLLSFALHANENHPLLFGPEFTFKVKNTGSPGPEMIELREWMKRHLINNQDESDKFTLNTSTFYSPNNWDLTLAIDGSVIEAKMKPLTRDEYAKYSNDIQDALFVSAYNLNFLPQDYLGGGHINISINYFVDKPNLLRNFIIDLLNHSELGLGIWNYDTNNALSHALTRQKDWDWIRKLLWEFDHSDAEPQKRIRNLLEGIHSIFYNMLDPYKGYWTKQRFSTRGKNMAINLKEATHFRSGTGRIELRMFRPQPDMDTFVRQITLIEKRIQYLETLGNSKLELEPNFLKLHTKGQDAASEAEALTPPIDPQYALAEYYKYVTEAGEKWEDHTSYIWPAWIQNGELDKFNQSLCSKLLEESS